VKCVITIIPIIPKGKALGASVEIAPTLVDDNIQRYSEPVRSKSVAASNVSFAVAELYKY